MWFFQKKKKIKDPQVKELLKIRNRHETSQSEFDGMDIAEDMKFIIANGSLQQDVIIDDAEHSGGDVLKGFTLNHMIIKSGDQQIVLHPGDRLDFYPHLTFPDKQDIPIFYHLGTDTLTSNKVTFLVSIG